MDAARGQGVLADDRLVVLDGEARDGGETSLEACVSIGVLMPVVKGKASARVRIAMAISSSAVTLIAQPVDGAFDLPRAPPITPASAVGDRRDCPDRLWQWVRRRSPCRRSALVDQHLERGRYFLRRGVADGVGMLIVVAPALIATDAAARKSCSVRVASSADHSTSSVWVRARATENTFYRTASRLHHSLALHVHRRGGR